MCIRDRRIDGDRVQEVEIHLRFIGQFELPAPELTEEEVKRQEFLKKERIRSRERYQKLKSGERTVGVPVTLTCKCCGKKFASKRTNTLFCGPNCRAKFYRQELSLIHILHPLLQLFLHGHPQLSDVPVGLPTDGGKPCGAVLLNEQVIQHLLLLITEGEKELGEKAVSCQLVQLVGAGEEDVEKVSLTELTEPWQIHPEGSKDVYKRQRCISSKNICKLGCCPLFSMFAR